ncbi:MAG: error-prone DNA polymerase [Pseudomonadota bacterium]|nr:error-prone DNA polymerase [Pseudomonadota bacterium]
MLLPYAELHCLSNFSFLRGASHPEELVERAHALGYGALALTDECSVSGVVRAHLAARECKLPLIIGSEVKLDDGMKLVLLATDRESYGDVCQLITRGRRNAQKGSYRLTRADVTQHARGLLALWLPTWGPDDEARVAEGRWVASTFTGRAWLAAGLFARAQDEKLVSRLAALGVATELPIVATGDVHMHVRARRALQDTMTAIRLGKPLSQCGYALFPNGERFLRSRGRLGALYPPEWLARSVEIAKRCTFSLDSLRYEYPEEIVPAGATPASHLRALVESGLARRFGCAENVGTDVRALIEHELALINELRYEPYFLTVHDIVDFARSESILCQGRGSAANSAVCYALGITEVDPSRMSMLFERFISRERNEPPDIDVDFEHERREEVMQYVYRKYGRDRAALAATLVTYRPKSAVRDIGKALGLDLAQVERLSGVMAWWEGRQVAAERIREAGFDPDNPVILRLSALANELMGFPRHLSQHVGGFVIARGLLERMVPVENAAMEDRTIIQWDKDDLDTLGLLKVDCLALGMLTAIRKALDLVSTHRGTPIRMQDIPAEDPAVYAMARNADTVGVFQIESRAQQAMLPRLKPTCFYDLVIEVAIVRPGPIQGGMIHPYLRRRQGLEPVTYPSNEVKSVLERTMGVPIFQEQVMQLAIVAAGFTPGEADQLRRSMAAWRRRGGLEKFEPRLIEGMRARGYGEQFARQVCQQIQGFGEYGFPESHSASFALLVYVSAWLKCHEPAAFCAALLNSQPMGFYAPAQLVGDARRHDVEVRAIDVTMSDWDCTLEAGGCVKPLHPGDHGDARPNRPPHPAPALRLGLRLISGLSQKGAGRIMHARQAKPFCSVADLALRARLDKRDLDHLAAADALHSLAGHRHGAVWDVAGVERLPALLDGSRFDESVPTLSTPSEGQDIAADYRTIGLTLKRHPLALLRHRLERQRIIDARTLGQAPHGRLVRVAGLVIGRQRPDTASGVIFVTLEDETGAINVIVWRDLSDRQRRELLGSRLMGVYGTVERDGAVVHVIAGRLLDLSPLLGGLEVRSRDFH